MQRNINISNQRDIQLLFGPHDNNIKTIEDEFQVKIIIQPNSLKITGKDDNVEKTKNLLEYLLESIRTGHRDLGREHLFYLIRLFKSEQIKYNEMREKGLVFSFSTKQIGPRTKGQREYVEAIRNYDIVFAIGPAGTGKTYLAMASAVEAFKKGVVRRIILTRPAIEAGESLGFLPGDMYEKISPYLRPLYDALYEMMEAEQIERYLETGIIEVVPLAYMRGRTLNDAFIILDEAQNCTAEQMKMFLTRLGFDSKAVITGDITQSDLPKGKPIGLIQAQELLKDIEGIKFIYLSGRDVVRHPLVQRIIEAYETKSSNK
ncbi:MAG: PhoH family protein [Candidatus Omnitrophica bacterium]|nr:PhoH family protein [Candidatus Omnitrophota bacterium]